MQQQSLRKLVFTALLAALTCVGTIVIQIPSPMNGYVNLGDCFVLLSAWLLGPAAGTAAAGLGSALADLMSGYAYYAPGTLVIKGTMALAAAVLFRAIAGSAPSFGRVLAARCAGAITAEALMVLGYFGYAALLLGKGLAAAASVPGNLIQGVFGIVGSLLLVQALERTQILSKAKF